MTYKKNQQHHGYLPDAQHRITLLMIMVLLLIPMTGASYSVAVIAIIKGNYGVNEMGHQASRWLGLAVAGFITLYLGLHWYIIIRYYREVTRQIFGLKHFFMLYGLQILNVAVLVLSLMIDLYRLPTYMIPIILFFIVGYLIYLRRHILAGKPLT